MNMTIPKGKYGIAAFAAYMAAFGSFVGLAFVQAYRLSQDVVRYNSPEAVHARLIKSYDKQKKEIVELAREESSNAIDHADVADAYAVSARKVADELREDAKASVSFVESCSAANALGTDMPPVDCSTMSVTDAEPGSVEDVILQLGASGEKEPESFFDAARTHLFVNWGHGLNEDGRWRDDGAVAPDGTTERSLVMGIAETAYNHAKKVERLASVIPVGKEPHSLRDNVNYATDQASKLGCGSPNHVGDRRSVDCYLLSIHANSSPDSSKYGAIAFYNPYSVPSRQFAESLASCLGGRAVSDQSNRFGRLAMVRDVEQVDGVLLETGYLTNPQDLARLKSGKAGSQVAKCVEAFFDNR